jgi:long-chain acyl-CoA synthetase
MDTTFKLGAATKYPTWPLSQPASAARRVLQTPLFGLLALLAPVEVRGVEMLGEAQPPALFVANHTSHLDTIAVLKALPPAWRRRVAVAAAADYFYTQPWIGAGVSLLVNAFPLSRFAPAARVKDTFEHCARLRRSGWSILLYPEGTRSATGEMQRFKGGAGMLAVQLGVPVIPVYTKGLATVLPKGKLLPRPGSVTVSFGHPLTFAQGTGFRDATDIIEGAIRALSQMPTTGDRGPTTEVSSKQ